MVVHVGQYFIYKRFEKKKNETKCEPGKEWNSKELFYWHHPTHTLYPCGQFGLNTDHTSCECSAISEHIQLCSEKKKKKV